MKVVRYFKKARLDNWIRVTIGTDEEKNKFLDIIKNFKEDAK